MAARQMEYSEMPMLISRPVFAQKYFHYTPGDHVVFGGPTQISGKTQLAYDLLSVVATPACPVYVAVSKPKDPVTTHYAQINDWRIVREWPQPKHVSEVFGNKKYSGYVIWPLFGDLYGDRAKVQQVLGELISERYGASARSKKAKHGILMMDDTRDKEKVVGLKYEMTTVLTMSGAMGLGQWSFVQKPSQAGDTALMAYSAAKHWFLFKEPTASAREYYGQVGGVDPHYIEYVINNLGPRQAFYICRNGPTMAIVDSDSPQGKIGLT
jgi:hypothetical protein